METLVSLVVEYDGGFDRPILEDLDLRVPLRFRCARWYLDIGAHLCVEDNRRGFIAGRGEASDESGSARDPQRILEVWLDPRELALAKRHELLELCDKGSWRLLVFGQTLTH
jgi:hypothetical protein